MGNVTQLKVQASPNGFNTLTPTVAHYVNNYVGNSATTVTVPAGSTIVLFAADDDFYVRWDGSTAAVPGASVTDGNGSEINPTARRVKPLATFSIIGTSAGTHVSMSFYS